MKILVTGSTGQLGHETVKMFRTSGLDITGMDRSGLDFRQPENVKKLIEVFSADLVINCAAYTKVDMAEQEREEAFIINRDAVKALAEGVRNTKGRVLHISTNFIFDGERSHPYSEEDKPNPIGVYGASKLAGEEAVLDVLPEATIVRTAWVYGVHGNNFVKTMLKLAAERDEIRVVDDQIGTPTWTRDISQAILNLVNSKASGIYNFTNEGVASWYDLADAVIKNAKRLGMPINVKKVTPIPGNEYTTLAQRPHYSVLSKIKIRGVHNYEIPHWRESLVNMLSELQNIK
jgi:dTDP-4-dehydrorhamnose reductase